MTLKVTCPNCGPRYTTEFWFGGELVAHAAPAPAPNVDAVESDFDRVWLRANVAGVQAERWFHHAGCRRWLVAERDTRTNEWHGHA
jgi:heterotetrameric sarcosine oxidase delta subunit